MSTVAIPSAPWAILSSAGIAFMEKLPSMFTVSVTAVVAVRLPEVPVMVTVAVPFVANELAVKVRTLDEPEGFGLNVAVTPFGSPEAANVTLLENPFTGVTVIVLVPPAPPLAIEIALGEAERLKLETPVTVRLNG